MFYFLMPGLMTYNVILMAAAVIPAMCWAMAEA